MNDQDQAVVNRVLFELSSLAKNGLVTKEQVLAIFGTSPAQTQTSSKPNINLQKILYYIGGLIVLIGIVFFIYQFWPNMNQFSKTLLTLGSAVSVYSIGYYFYNNTPSKEFGHVFLLLAAVLFPLGVGTTLDIIGVSATKYAGVTINTSLLFIIYFVSYYYLKAKVFLPFSIIAASGLFISSTNFLFQNSRPISHFDEYRIMILGLSYISFGYYFSETQHKFMTNFLYFFGLLMALTVGITLQGFATSNNFFWEALYPFVLVLVFYGSIKLQNRVFLIIATLFTFIEILKLTAEYFSKSIGWPVSLIIAGLIIMVIGYLSFELDKKFLKAPNQSV